MDDRHGAADGDAPADVATGFEPRRALVGGLTVLGAILGFTAVSAAVDTGGVPDEWILVALPAFGIVGLVGFVVFLSAVVSDR